jgi:hypothetical protein
MGEPRVSAGSAASTTQPGAGRYKGSSPAIAVAGTAMAATATIQVLRFIVKDPLSRTPAARQRHVSTSARRWQRPAWGSAAARGLPSP